MVASEAVTARVRGQYPDRLSTAGASRPEAQAIRRTAESLETLGACSQYLMRRLRYWAPSRDFYLSGQPIGHGTFRDMVCRRHVGDRYGGSEAVRHECNLV